MKKLLVIFIVAINMLFDTKTIHAEQTTTKKMSLIKQIQAGKNLKPTIKQKKQHTKKKSFH